MALTTFQQKVLSWFDSHGRKNLPWQQNITPYRIWVSEIMLQQTQVNTVIPYFNKFIEQFPDVEALALASLDAVLHYWSGLGYYARARNLHKAAKIIRQKGSFPDSIESLTELPGVGISTAGAILSIAFSDSHPILDGNVKRVLTRYHGIEGWTGGSKVTKELWSISHRCTPGVRVADYTQAIMDLGATVCKRSSPLCCRCPIKTDCVANLEGRTMELPTPKPQKRLPVKHSAFLILYNNNSQILLNKRPPTGIWGGLWSLPEFDLLENAISWCATQNIVILGQEILPVHRHTFSHYHLDYTPVIVRTNNPINVVMEADQTVWYNNGLESKLGLPIPVKRLLGHVLQNN